MSSYTFTLTGNSSKLDCNIFPEVILDEKSDYSCALLELTTYHSIPNIIEDVNNAVIIYVNKNADKTYKATDGSSKGDIFLKVQLATGCYEAHELLELIKQRLAGYGFSFEYAIDKNTFKTSIKCDTAIYIGDEYSNNILKKVFGYSQNKPKIPKNTKEESQDIIKIASQDVVRVECNIVSGSYVNNKSSHTIHEFATNKVDVGYKIIERPRNLIYMPVTHKRLSSIEISLVDQNGTPIDFRGETVTCRIHVRRE